jgi:3-deoxy-7-phosphoheptulonate synthase
MEYADKLRPAVAKYAADLVVVMRVYFEKPRTNVGWKVRG